MNDLGLVDSRSRFLHWFLSLGLSFLVVFRASFCLSKLMRFSFDTVLLGNPLLEACFQVLCLATGDGTVEGFGCAVVQRCAGLVFHDGRRLEQLSLSLLIAGALNLKYAFLSAVNLYIDVMLPHETHLHPILLHL